MKGKEMNKTIILTALLLIFLITAENAAIANEWLIENYSLDKKEINKGINRIVSGKTMVPVGLDVLDKRLYVHYVPNRMIGVTQWNVDLFNTVKSFNAGVDRHVAQGYIPVDLTVFGETMLVLFLKMKMKIDSWKWITTKVDGKEIAQGIKKFRNQGYVPSGITTFSNTFGILLIRPVTHQASTWQIGSYSRDASEIRKEILKEIAAGYTPFGLLTGSRITNVMLLKLENKSKPSPAASQTPTASQTPATSLTHIKSPTSNVSPTSTATLALKPEMLMGEISEFLSLLRANPEQASDIYITPEGKPGFMDISTLCGPAMKFLATGEVPMISWLGPSEAMVGLYHPWADLMLLTEWRASNFGAAIHSLELVTGDFLRNGGEPPYQIMPLWRQPGQGLPPEALRKTVSETGAAFRSIFRDALPGGKWRMELPAFRNATLLTANASLGALSLSRILKSFHALASEPDKKALAKELGKTMKMLGQGGIREILQKTGKGSAGSTSSAGSARYLQKTSASYWSQAQIMDLVTAREGALVFLNSPGSPWVFISLLFDLHDGRAKLQRIDLIDLPDGSFNQ
ncbi:MAG: hypothetical protein CVV64_18115 [Candidatus Wallbacteria bacterium HGW-Wallbacteria-1]|uniref:Uncharacterized protein n=1 Tax=Candidatus Wallbacteria bacterium HGW-Wallbacteria-1 TaxID=2013854 RepID=A0A2N1PJT1_9BACT|nr:MAG: hypothetical protein CVV64_18115 [Candidatus Wallbacteria bacterium HGW-Wallbacteria-1]